MNVLSVGLNVLPIWTYHRLMLLGRKTFEFKIQTQSQDFEFVFLTLSKPKVWRENLSSKVDLKFIIFFNCFKNEIYWNNDWNPQELEYRTASELVCLYAKFTIGKKENENKNKTWNCQTEKNTNEI